jgi:hypothetical protein
LHYYGLSRCCLGENKIGTKYRKGSNEITIWEGNEMGMKYNKGSNEKATWGRIK